MLFLTTFRLFNNKNGSAQKAIEVRRFEPSLTGSACHVELTDDTYVTFESEEKSDESGKP